MNLITLFLTGVKLQDLNINQIKLEVHDTYKKDEKITTNLEASNPENFINNAYLDDNIIEINGHLSLLEKDHNEFKIPTHKQSIEEVLIQRAMKTTIQILCVKVLFDKL